MNVDEIYRLVDTINRKRKTNRLAHYQPYPFQRMVHEARDGQGELASTRVLLAASQVGKTTCAAYEIAIHTTGLYPDWWTGWRFDRPIQVMIGSNTNETARDICQKELFGDPDDEKALGTGTVPLECIGDRVRKPGVPNAYSAVLVKHVSGGISKVSFRAYEQGYEKHMGIKFDLGWLDEEPPGDVFSQYNRAILATRGILLLTFTPEQGVTEVVSHFLHDIKPGEVLYRATWDDAPHFADPVYRQRALERFPAHEREMRAKGVPFMGSGLVFPVTEESITCSPFELPKHWPRICGMDFGYDHPFAAAWIAWDRDADVVYVYDGYRESKATPPIHAAAVKSRGDWIPAVWPHDGLQHDKGSGIPLADQYRDLGVNMLREKFSNPPAPGQKEGQGGQGVEVGVMEMLTRMETGRLKVFSNVQELLEEIRIYHRKDGKLVKLRDDLISAARYACQSLRFAETQTLRLRPQVIVQGISNW